jgi:hypothetical protein
MTVNTWRGEILKICKNCGRFYDNGKSRYRYKCQKFVCNIYEAYGCGKLKSVMTEAQQVSDIAVQKALNDLLKPL